MLYIVFKFTIIPQDSPPLREGAGVGLYSIFNSSGSDGG